MKKTIAIFSILAILSMSLSSAVFAEELQEETNTAALTMETETEEANTEALTMETETEEAAQPVEVPLTVPEDPETAQQEDLTVPDSEEPASPVNTESLEASEENTIPAEIPYPEESTDPQVPPQTETGVLEGESVTEDPGAVIVSGEEELSAEVILPEALEIGEDDSSDSRICINEGEDDDSLTLQDTESTEEEVEKDGFRLVKNQWRWYQNDKFQKKLTGLVYGNINGIETWYYIVNGVFSPTSSGITRKAGKTSGSWYYIQNGVYSKSTGIAQKADGSSGKWYYVQNGKYKKATGVARRADGTSSLWYYVKNGVFTESTGIAQRADGVKDGWYYMENGYFSEKSGLVKKISGSSSKYYYVLNGIYTKATGIAKRLDGTSSKWYYIQKGVPKKATGVAKKADGSSGTWFYVKNGVYYNKVTGIARPADGSGGWYYVQKGKFKKVTGISRKADSSSKTWYFVKNGVYTQATGIAQKADGSSSTWFFVKNGKYNKTTSGAAYKADGSSKMLFYVQNGKFTKKTLLAHNVDGSLELYYLKDGKLDTSFSGRFKGYTIINGIATHYKGLDISYWNGAIDFTKVNKAGYKFIIPRCGWGTEDIDPSLYEYVPAALAAGIEVPGIYHFVYATSLEEVKQNAQLAIDSLAKVGLPKSTVIWCDLEYDSADYYKKVTKKDLSDADQKLYIETFCNYILSKGYATGVYVNQDYMARVLGRDFGKYYDLWLADWEGEAAYECVYRQTGYQGKIAGIACDFDTNEYYGQYTAGTSIPRMTK